MKKQILLISIIIIITAARQTAYSAEVILENDKAYYANITSLEYFADKTNSLTINEVSDKNFEGFQKAATTTPSFGFIEYPVWIRIHIKNNSSENSWILETMNTFIDTGELYDLSTNTTMLSSRMVPISQRLMMSKYVTFPLTISPGQEKELYIKYMSEDTLFIPLTVKTYNAQKIEEMLQHLLFGLFFGISIMMLVYNIYTFLITKEFAHLYYSLYLMCYIIWAVAISGFGYLYVWKNSPLFNANSAILSANFYAIFLCLFSISFLNLKDNHKKLFRIIIFIMMLAIGILFSSVYTSIRVQAKMLNIISLSVGPLFLFSGFYTLLKGYKPARLYLLSYIIWWFFMGIWISRNIGMLPETLLTRYAVYVGSIFEIVLFSFALSNKMSISKKEKAAALKSLVEHQKLALDNQIKMINSFSRFVPSEFLQYLNRKLIIDVELGDHVQKNLTVMFADIRSFTSLSESMLPEETFNFLNSYLKRIGPVVRANGGFIDKYIGDGIMSLFPENADTSIKSALEMLDALKLYNSHRQNSGYKGISIGIGIHIGSTILGTIGEKDRIETTVISDAVNLASRLEGLTKLYGAPIIISDDLYKSLEHPEDFTFRKLDCIKVKGKNNPIIIYEVLGYNHSCNEKISLKNKYEDALELYISGRISEAVVLYNEMLADVQNDIAVSLFLARCEKLAVSGVPEDWCGIEILDMKRF